jgi:pyruvate kinase
MIPGAMNKDMATPMLKAGTNRIRAIRAEVLDIVKLIWQVIPF